MGRNRVFWRHKKDRVSEILLWGELLWERSESLKEREFDLIMTVRRSKRKERSEQITSRQVG